MEKYPITLAAMRIDSEAYANSLEDNWHDENTSMVTFPAIGIKSNTHALFADLNNLKIVNHLEACLKSKKPDKRAMPNISSAPLKPKSVTISLQRYSIFLK
jgi:hypothetical protein